MSSYNFRVPASEVRLPSTILDFEKLRRGAALGTIPNATEKVIKDIECARKGATSASVCDQGKLAEMGVWWVSDAVASMQIFKSGKPEEIVLALRYGHAASPDEHAVASRAFLVSREEDMAYMNGWFVAAGTLGIDEWNERHRKAMLIQQREDFFEAVSWLLSIPHQKYAQKLSDGYRIDSVVDRFRVDLNGSSHTMSVPHEQPMLITRFIRKDVRETSPVTRQIIELLLSSGPVGAQPQR